MKEIIVTSSISIRSMALLGGTVFIILFILLLMTTGTVERENTKIKRAKKLIEEGHAKVLEGKKDDGIYEETRRERTPEA